MTNQEIARAILAKLGENGEHWIKEKFAVNKDASEWPDVKAKLETVANAA